MKRITLILVVLTGCGGNPHHFSFEELPSIPDTQPIRLQEGTLAISLERSLELAMGGNYRIQLGRLAPRQRAEDFFIAGQVFSPVIEISASLGDDATPAISTLGGAPILKEDELVLKGSILKKWDIGLRSDLYWAYAKRDANSSFITLDPRHESSVELEVSQPLLQGFGAEVNASELHRAVNNRKIASLEFHMVLEAELLRTYRAYWTLLLAAEDLALQQESLRLAGEQIAIAEDRLAAGKAAQLEVTGARAAHARQMENVIDAKTDYRKASDQLLQIIRPSTRNEDYEIVVIPTTKPNQEELPDGIKPVDAIREALANRPELGRERSLIDNADLDLLLANDETYTNLELFGKIGAKGIEDSAGDSIGDTGSADFLNWSAGIRLQFLFDSESRRARYRQAVLAKEEATLRMESVASEITVEVRAALFDFDAAREKVTATKRTLDLAREQYEGEVDRRKTGRSTQYQVELFRRDLLDAERNHLRARVRLFLARAVLDASMGRFAKSIVESAGS